MERMLVWSGDEPFTSELVRVARDDASGSLSAAGVALGVDPVPYLLEYRLEVGPGWVTRSLDVATSGAGWSRELSLSRDAAGWHVSASWEGSQHLAAAGGDPDALHPAFDVELARSPLFASLPLLREGLLRPGAPPARTIAAWVSVPGLAVLPARRVLHPVAPGRVRLDVVDAAYAVDLAVDADGLVSDWPDLARRRA